MLYGEGKENKKAKRERERGLPLKPEIERNGRKRERRDERFSRQAFCNNSGGNAPARRNGGNAPSNKTEENTPKPK